MNEKSQNNKSKSLSHKNHFTNKNKASMSK